MTAVTTATCEITLTGYDEFSKRLDEARRCLCLSRFESLGAVAVATGAALAMNEWAQAAKKMEEAREMDAEAMRIISPFNASDEETTTAAIGYEPLEGSFDCGTTEPEPTPARQALPRKGPGRAGPEKPKNYLKQNLYRQDRRSVRIMRKIK